MEDLFEMVRAEERDKGAGAQVRLALRFKVGPEETLCPVSKPCDSYETLEKEIARVKDNLDRVLDAAKGIFGGKGRGDGLDLDPDMDGGQIWAILAAVGDEALFVRGFNGLEESRRREVAEHVRTKCNVFSGKAALVSSRYDDETALME